MKWVGKAPGRSGSRWTRKLCERLCGMLRIVGPIASSEAEKEKECVSTSHGRRGRSAESWVLRGLATQPRN